MPRGIMRNLIYRPSLFVLLIICLTGASLVFAGQSQQKSETASAPADAAKNAAAQTAVNQIIEKIVARETALGATMKGMHPLVETYIQNLDKDDELAFHPTGDQYFLGKLQFNPGAIHEKTFLNDEGVSNSIFSRMKQMYSVRRSEEHTSELQSHSFI